MTNLAALGWSPFFEQQMAGLTEEQRLAGGRPVRVISEHRGLFRVTDGATERWAELAGKLRHDARRGSALYPTVGDWALATPSGDRAILQHILQRKSWFARKRAGTTVEAQGLAANIDTAFIVSSLNLDLNVRRIERYLSLVWESGARPVILLTKLDLCPDAERLRSEVAAAAPGVSIHTLSAKHGQGLDQLGAYLGPGTTSVVLGSSGVGKSTLINALVGKTVQEIADIREDDDRGRHTTRVRELVMLTGRGMIIDTPGLREIQLWDADEGIQNTFPEVDEHAPSCRFRDCRHQAEPGCAVRAAVAAGTIRAERLDAYFKLQEEQSQLDRKKKLGKKNKP